MASGATMTIEGLAEYLRTLDEAPDVLIKCVRKSMRKAGTELARDMKAGIPAGFRPLVKCKVVKARISRNLSSAVGLYKSASKDDDGFKWFKAYWKNYGTLARRDPSHRFDNPIKPDGTQAAMNRRNRIGQFSERFFEAALPPGWESRYVSTFVREMRSQGYDIQ